MSFLSVGCLLYLMLVDAVLPSRHSKVQAKVAYILAEGEAMASSRGGKAIPEDELVDLIVEVETEQLPPNGVYAVQLA